MSVQMLDGSLITPTGAKTRGLLAILALSDRRAVTRRSLAHLLWSRRSDEQARASLRQEIHRLSDVLSPLGTDILDVQRHTLALKPILTAVDAERYLNATASGILKLPGTDAALLTDLDSVDPALDEWLAAQRNRLQQHLIATLEQALLSLSETEQKMIAASRLLHLDRLNENAWKVQLRELARRNDTRAGLFSAEQCLAAFRETLDAEPGPSTMAVISELRAQHVNGKGALERGTTPPDAGRPELSDLAIHLPSGQSSADHFEHHGVLSGHIASVGFLQMMAGPRLPISAGQVETLFDLLAAELVQFGFLSIFPPCNISSDKEKGTRSENLPQPDYLVETKFQACTILPGTFSAETHDNAARLTIRVTDQRRGNVIIWADRFHITPETIDDIAALLTTEIAWRIAVTEARNAAGRSAEDLLPVEAGLRALALVSRNDPGSYLQVQMLLERALQREPDHPFLLLVSAIFRLVRSFEQWSVVKYKEDIDAATDAARHLVRVMPESITGRLILTRLLLNNPIDQTYGCSLLEELKSVTPSGGVIATIDAYSSLANGDAAAAYDAVELFMKSHPTHPFMDLFDVDFVLLLLLTGRTSDAVRRAKTSLSTAPTRIAMLVLCLAALDQLQREGAADTQGERDVLKDYLARLAPCLSVNMVMAHYSHFPASQRIILTKLLISAGIPETAPAASQGR
ncbi:AfsR/SARP family transcriptional regulator [Acetobacter fallax]|nr:helix-turn-helix domain-containing protein [Acetobacter fallax]